MNYIRISNPKGKCFEYNTSKTSDMGIGYDEFCQELVALSSVLARNKKKVTCFGKD